MVAMNLQRPEANGGSDVVAMNLQKRFPGQSLEDVQAVLAESEVRCPRTSQHALQRVGYACSGSACVSALHAASAMAPHGGLAGTV